MWAGCASSSNIVHEGRSPSTRWLGEAREDNHRKPLLAAAMSLIRCDRGSADMGQDSVPGAGAGPGVDLWIQLPCIKRRAQWATASTVCRRPYPWEITLEFAAMTTRLSALHCKFKFLQIKYNICLGDERNGYSKLKCLASSAFYAKTLSWRTPSLVIDTHAGFPVEGSLDHTRSLWWRKLSGSEHASPHWAYSVNPSVWHSYTT